MVIVHQFRRRYRLLPRLPPSLGLSAKISGSGASSDRLSCEASPLCWFSTRSSSAVAPASSGPGPGAGGRLSAGTRLPLPLRPFLVERYPGWTDGSDSLSSSEVEPLSLSELLDEYADNKTRDMWQSLSLGYPSHNEGSPFLRRAIAGRYNRSGHGCSGTIKAPIDESHVNVVVPQEGIYLASRALLSPGDHVVVTAPMYQSLGEVARSIGCEVSAWRPKGLGAGARGGGAAGFEPSALESLLRPGETKLVIANFPHNPTGALPTRDEFDRIIAACESSGCHLLIDEMYRGLEHCGVEMLPAACALDYDKCVSLSGVSKTVGLPGLRIGWLVSRDERFMSRVAQLKDYTTICPPVPSEVLALMALRSEGALLERSRELLSDGLAAAREMVSEFPDHLEWLEPRGGTFAFVRLRSSLCGTAKSFIDAEAYCESLRRRSGIMLMPGGLFDLDHTPSCRGGGEGDGSAARERVRVTFGRRDTRQMLGLWSEDLGRDGVCG